FGTNTHVFAFEIPEALASRTPPIGWVAIDGRGLSRTDGSAKGESTCGGYPEARSPVRACDRGRGRLGPLSRAGSAHPDHPCDFSDLLSRADCQAAAASSLPEGRRCGRRGG